MKLIEFDIEAVKTRLQDMVNDVSLVTQPVFRANTLKYPSNEMSFVDYHLFCLSHNKTTSVDHYLSNLRMRIKIR